MVAAFPQAATSSTESRTSSNGPSSKGFAQNPQNQQKQNTQLQENPARPPLLSSTTEKDNGHSRKPRGRQVPSRYLSPSPFSSSSSSAISSSSSTTTTKRYPSPLLSRSTNSNLNSTTTTTTTPSLLPKRSQSVDRRRTVAPRSVTPVPGGNATELSAATKMLITSTRSLSVSFQGEAFSLPISKKKEASTPTLHRKSTPERRRATPVRDHGENSRPTDQQRWPGRSRPGSSVSNPLTRSLDYSGEARKPSGFGSGMVVKSLQQSMIDESGRVSLDGRLSLDLSNGEDLLSTKQNPDAISANDLASSVSCDLTASDTDSVSSGSTNGVQECGGGISRGKTGARGILVSARFWQETNSRLRRFQEPGSPLSTSPVSRIAVPSSKFSQSKRFSSDGPVLSPRTMASPIRGATRPASPSKLWASSTSSPARGIPSPSRVRAGSGQMGNYNSSPSILSFSVDIRRGKIGEDRILDAHMLRLLYNRYLQWRFVNARTDATFMLQRLDAEKNLWNAWVTMSELRHSVTLKRIKLHLLRQKLKLTSILKGQAVAACLNILISLRTTSIWTWFPM